MNTRTPSLRFTLHQPAVDAFKAEPPPPVVATKAAMKEHREAVKLHYFNALCDALSPLTESGPTRYQRAMFRGIIHRLKGQKTAIAKPLIAKHKIMPSLREWAEKRGLI